MPGQRRHRTPRARAGWRRCPGCCFSMAMKQASTASVQASIEIASSKPMENGPTDAHHAHDGVGVRRRWRPGSTPRRAAPSRGLLTLRSISQALAAYSAKRMMRRITAGSEDHGEADHDTSPGVRLAHGACAIICPCSTDSRRAYPRTQCALRPRPSERGQYRRHGARGAPRAARRRCRAAGGQDLHGGHQGRAVGVEVTKSLTPGPGLHQGGARGARRGSWASPAPASICARSGPSS